jgi:hypothetical protein
MHTQKIGRFRPIYGIRQGERALSSTWERKAIARQGKNAELEGESIRRGKRAAPDEHGEK